MTAIYLRHENDAKGCLLGDVPLIDITDPRSDWEQLVGQLGVLVDNVGIVDQDFLTGQFVYEPDGRGAIFELVIGASDEDSD